MFDLVFILWVALHIHVTRIPVALLRLALRTPVRPDAELGVTKPVRRLILLERIPRRLKFSRRNRFRRRVDEDLGNKSFGNRVAGMKAKDKAREREKG